MIFCVKGIENLSKRIIPSQCRKNRKKHKSIYSYFSQYISCKLLQNNVVIVLNSQGVLYFNVKNFFLIFSPLRFLYFHKKEYSLVISKYIRNRILKAFVKRKKAYTILKIINSMHSSIFHSRKEKEIFMDQQKRKE